MAFVTGIDSDLAPLADIVVHDTRCPLQVACALAAATLHRLPGCVLVAVGLADGGCLLRSRELLTVVSFSASTSTRDLVELAEIAYQLQVRLALASRLAALRGPQHVGHRCGRRSGTRGYDAALPG
jgi:hypothetical protein